MGGWVSELCEIRESFLPRKFPVCICESKDVHVYLSILSQLCESHCTHNLSVYNQSRTSKEERFTNLSVTNVYIYIACLFCVALSFVTGPFSHNIILVGKAFVVSHKTLHLMNCFLKGLERAPRGNKQLHSIHMSSSACKSLTYCRIQSCIS